MIAWASSRCFFALTEVMRDGDFHGERIHNTLLTDQDIEDIRRHAETMACIVVEMYQEHCRASE